MPVYSRLLKTPLLFFLVFSLSSCFDVIEKVAINSNGGGDYTLIFNASKSKVKLNSIMQMKSINGHRVPPKSEILSKIKEMETMLRNTKGVSNVTITTDFNNYVGKLTCKFDNVESLNTAIRNLKKTEKGLEHIPNQVFSLDAQNKVFVANRKNLGEVNYNTLSTSDKELLSQAKFTSIFQFDKGVKNTENKEFKLSSNARSLINSGSIAQFLRNQKSLYNKITLQ